MVPLLGLIADSQFEDAHALKTGTMVEGTILTVSPGKNKASGWVDYHLPSGVSCHDWTELAPNGVVHPGETILLAVGSKCGHPVSSKKKLFPWLYLCVFLGSFWPIYSVWNSRRQKKRIYPPAY